MSEYCTCATSFDGSCEIHDQITALKAQLAVAQDQILVLQRQAEMNTARLAEATNKAIRFDLDQLGIEAREHEAVELVELRAQLAEAKRLLWEWQATADVAQDMTFVPVARRTYSFFHTAPRPRHQTPENTADQPSVMDGPCDKCGGTGYYVAPRPADNGSAG